MRTFAQKQKQSQKPVSSNPARSHMATPWLLHRPDLIQHLHRTIGNQALLGLLQNNAEERNAIFTGTALPQFGHDFARIPVTSPKADALQTKLTINKPGDDHEQEADRMAEQVMRTPQPQFQRTYTCGGGRLKWHTDPPGRKHESFQTKRVQASETGQIAAPPLVHEVLRSPGQPLDPVTRAYFEPRFRQDFSRVRVHVGPQAAAATESVRAHAFTVGHNLVFGAGRFSPASSEGRKLLAHELTHVVQQAGSATPVLRRDDKKAPTTMKPAPAPEEEVPADTLSLIQVRWAKLKGAVAKFPLLKEWVAKGDAVIALMLDHEIGYYRAIEAGDAHLAAFYKQILQGELVAYNYVSWHAYVYRNWLRLQARFDSLVQSFDADKRDFAGKHEAEEKVRVIKKLIDSVGNQSANTLRDLVVDHPYTFRPGMVITVTSAADMKKRAALKQETENLRNTDLAVGVSIDDINTFLWNATKEGFWQAVEAIKEYYEVRKGILDDGGGADVDDKSNQPSSQSQTGSGAGTGSGSGSQTEKEKKPGEPCDVPLPIKWPRNLPLPADSRPLVRTPSGNWNLEPEKRSTPQRDLYNAIVEARRKNVLPPRLCFKDAEPNTPFEAHHMHPLFLGGAEDKVNLCSLFIDYHQIGHRQLLDQSGMVNSDPVWKACKITKSNLKDHPGGQEYEIRGRK